MTSLLGRRKALSWPSDSRRPEQVYFRALAMDGFALGETVQRAVHRIDRAWDQPPVPLRRFTS